jgi:hypothetical protein
MYCASDVNTGFIKLTGPIQKQYLDAITHNRYPLTLNFGARTTPPTLIGNRIEDSTGSSCTYAGKTFDLKDVQICSVIHTGYLPPGQTGQPVAELVLSYKANATVTNTLDAAGILLTIAIYDSGPPQYDEYLNQLVDSSLTACNYSYQPGTNYGTPDYQQLPNLSLSNCVKSCCGDPNCLAYTYQSGTCHLKNSTSQLTTILDQSYSSGAIDRMHPRQAPPPSAMVPTLQSIFSAWPNDNRQASFGYTTCFETMDGNNNPQSKNLFILHFPIGIRLLPSIFQQFVLASNGTLPRFMLSPAIRGTDGTLQTYYFDTSGKKVGTQTSADGFLYSTALPTCNKEFTDRFQYFTLAPRLPTTTTTTSSNETCPTYKTSEYKCVPFNETTDLKDGIYVKPGTNRTLNTVLDEKNAVKNKQDNPNQPAISIATLEAIIGGTVGGVVLIVGVIFAIKTFSKSDS